MHTLGLVSAYTIEGARCCEIYQKYQELESLSKVCDGRKPLFRSTCT